MPIFFMLSGLVLGYRYNDKYGTFSAFYRTRIARIYPAYIMGVLMCVPFLPFMQGLDAATLFFIVPVLIILPFKLAALWLIGHGRFIAGALVFIAAKFAGVGAAAFIFDIAREKLLSMAWFARLYGWVVAAQHWAKDLVAPYKERVKAFLAPLKARVRALFDRQGHSRFAQRIALLKQKMTRP